MSAQDSVLARKYIRDLSAAEMHGRGYAYRGDSIAAEYIRAQFRRMEIPPFHFEDYYHRYSFPVYAMEGAVTAEVAGKKLAPWTDFAPAPYSHAAYQKFTVLPIKPEQILDGDALVKFLGKHTDVLANSLLYVDLATCTDAEVRKKLTGMFAYLSVNNGQLPFRGFLVGVEEIPVWSFNYAREACDYVLVYVKSGIVGKKTREIDLSFDNRFGEHNTQNVCAMIRGVGAPDTVVIVGGHYDHLGQMGDEVLFSGAHDNASGTAAVLDMARYFKENPPHYTMIFTLFSGEEAGLLGSLAFVRDSLLDFGKVKLMLNIDLMGGGDDGFTVVNADGENTKEFFQLLTEINERERLVKEVRPRKNANISDHAPFVMKGMPAVFVYTMGGRTGGYHQPDDTNENCSLSAYNGTVRLFIKALEGLRK